MDSLPLYRQLAAHYVDAIHAGSLKAGDKLPSLRSLMRLHDISLSTALQVCRAMESEGWVEARDRSGYFVRRPQRLAIAAMEEPVSDLPPDPAQFVNMRTRMANFMARGRLNDVKLNFAISRAAPELYPAEALRNAMTRALRQRPDLLTTASSQKGHEQFRQVVAQRNLRVGMTVAPDDVLVTNGCIEALNLALRAIAKPGDTVAVESPTFYGLLQVLESLGLRGLEIPTSPQTGISLEALDLAIHTYDDIKAVVVVPHLQNPIGSVMPDAHKQRLVQLCESHGIALVEDDTYSDLVETEVPPRAIKSWDRTGNVVYCASLHKVLAPGLRLGWITAGRWHAQVEMLKYAQTRNNEALAQIAAGEIIASGGYDRHLRRLRERLHTQRDQTADAIARYFPAGTRLNLPRGGFQLWVELPERLSSVAVFEAALREHMLVAPGAQFSNASRFDHYLRINCGWPFSEAVDAGLRRLGRIVEEGCAAQKHPPATLVRSPRAAAQSSSARAA
ncbi:DNA-binding transcriptional MocR family regulator [Variovorax boronicumulans]|uniref:DNA-binding transcriptional MocR family regulator n=1 Tax=Variovorax boronicumulans TaxID=436515 RepID=A0AAW8DR34_9BURK|nr:PLP-dependent aminotransferase family protein [Variovorax boronicumulans]MDP9877231.1 DNA-binding transcriptional MocR family regulator [Variovorax boronicumulans]MDP9921892.1 DNA-binding transcriptional MocR family regulator [Variovorax boronicumulans]